MPTPADQFLPFRVGETICVLPVAEVRETLQTRPVTPVYHMPKAVTGLIQIRGEIFPLLDLAVLLGGTSHDTPPPRRIVVARISERVAGILAQHVRGTIAIEDSSFEPVPADLGPSAAAFLTAIARTPIGVVGRLSLERVFDSAQIQATAS